MPVRWVSFARVSMQRLGNLVAVAAAASESSPRSLQALTKDYTTLVRTRRTVEADQAEDVLAYLRALRLWRRYGGRQGELAKLNAEQGLPPVELQDIWLSDPRLPSATGAVTDEVIGDMPQLATSLGLVRPHNYTRAERGRALTALYFGRGDAGTKLDATNLLRLVTASPPREGDRPGAACFLLYSILEADGDFASASWSTQLTAGEDPFTRASFGALLPDACRHLADRVSRSRDLKDRPLVARLDALARHIEERTPGTEKTWGGGRPRDQAATLRLEPYVDFGLVTRRSRTDYSYSLDVRQQSFFDALTSAPSLNDFLDDSLMNTYLLSLGIAPRRLPADEIWTRIESAYALLRSGLGYAPAKDVVLLAIASLLDEGGRGYFEVRDGLQVIREQQKRHPGQVRYGVSSSGEPTYIRLGRGASE